MWMCADDSDQPHVQWPVIGFSRHFWANQWDLVPTKNLTCLPIGHGNFGYQTMALTSVMPPEFSRLQRNYVLLPQRQNSFNFVGHCALHFKALPCDNQLEVVRCQLTSRSVFVFCVCVSSTQGKSQSGNVLVINIQRCLTKKQRHSSFASREHGIMNQLVWSSCRLASTYSSRISKIDPSFRRGQKASPF